MPRKMPLMDLEQKSIIIPFKTPSLLLLFGLPSSVHEPMRTSTPSNCYGLVRIGSATTTMTKCLTTADISCPVILPG